MFYPIENAGLFLIQIIFNLYLAILILRIILQQVGASFYNPICQFISKLTNPCVLPIRQRLPRIHFIDIATVIVITIIELSKLLLLHFIVSDEWPTVVTLLSTALADVIDQIINIFFYAIILMVIFSWIKPNSHQPIQEILYRVSDPLLRPLRRIIPVVAGIDISPVFALIGLKLISIIVVQSLLD